MIYLFHPLLLEFPCQRAAMHAEPPRGFGYIEIRFSQYFVNSFPFQRLDGRGTVSQLDVACTCDMSERRFDVVSV